MIKYVYISVAALSLMAGIYAYGYHSGAEAVRAANIKETLENTRSRETNDQKIDALPDTDLDKRFNRWVLPS